MENVENYDEKKQVREREGERKRERGRARERERRGVVGGWGGAGHFPLNPQILNPQALPRLETFFSANVCEIVCRCFLPSHPQVVLTLIT